MSLDPATLGALEMPDDSQKELSIKEEYQLWRKNCRYMYEFVSETALTWPSLTVQWLPEHKVNPEGEIDAKLLLGTHTSGEDTDYLKIASTQLPDTKSKAKKEDGEANKKVSTRIKIKKKYTNKAEINRARYLPQDSSIVATINGSGHIDLYDLSKETNSGSYAHFEPHTQNGYGLSWSPHKKNHLLTASDDSSVVLSDISKLDSNNGQIFKNTTATDIVNDVKWHCSDENLFGSVSDDGYAYIFDIRTPNTPVSKFYGADSKGINSLSFSPFSHNLIAIGNTNSNVNLLDLRNLSIKDKSNNGLLHTMMGHSDSITSLEFSPHQDGIIASGSQDRRLIIWDLFRVGEEQAQEDAEDGCPELFMMHAGHTGAVTDLSWCPYANWTLASVADDNIVHLWEMSKGLLELDKPLDLKASDLE